MSSIWCEPVLTHKPVWYDSKEPQKTTKSISVFLVSKNPSILACLGDGLGTDTPPAKMGTA